MGFYYNEGTLTLHTDACNTAKTFAGIAAPDNSNWKWFATYTDAFLHAKKIRQRMVPHSDCGPKPDDMDARLIALHDHLMDRFGSSR